MAKLKRLVSVLATVALGVGMLAGGGGVSPAQASSNGDLDSSSNQLVYAYTDAGGTLDVSGTFYTSTKFCSASWDSSLLATAQIVVTDPTGTVTKIQAPYDGCTSDVTVSRNGITASGGQGGVWQIAYLTLDSSGKISPSNWDGVHTELGAMESADVFLDWTVTPRQGGSEKTGRVWTERLMMRQTDSMSAARNVNVYYLSETGAQYQTISTTYNGINSILSADSMGVGNSNCQPSYRSWNQADSGYKLADDCPSRESYRLFREIPDDSMPASARSWNGGTTWVYPVYQPASLGTPQMATPTGVVNYPSAQIRVPVNGQRGTVTIQIDVDGDGSYTGANDVTLSAGTVNAGGTAAVTWDGKTASGGSIPVTQKINIRATLAGAGEIHFVAEDVEERAGGIQVIQIVGPNPFSTNISWDDSQLGAGCWRYDGSSGDWVQDTCVGDTPSPLKATNVSSAGGVHAWSPAAGTTGSIAGTWGDSRLIDDWTSYQVSVNSSVLTVQGVPPTPDLSISKDDGQTTVQPGQQLTYTLTVVNSGDGDATGARVADTLPSGVSFVSASNNGTLASGVVTWTGLSIPAGGKLSITAILKVNSPIAQPSTLKNVAMVWIPDLIPPVDCATGSNPAQCATDTDTVPAPTLTVTKDDGQTTVQPGQQITYTITVNNTGGGDSVGTMVSDPLPAGMTFVSASDNGANNGGTITWPAFTLAAGGKTTRTVTATVNSSIAQPSTLANTATVWNSNLDQPDCTATADKPRCGTDTDTVPAPHVVVSKTDGVTVVVPGQTLTYTITANNTGAGDALSQVLTDPIPANTTFVSASDSGAYNTSSRTVTWPAVRINAGATISRQIVVTVNNDIPRPSSLTNTAVITGPGQGVPDCSGADKDRCGIDTDQTLPAILSVSKTSDHTGVLNPGDQVVYTITGRNSGTGDEPGAVLADTLPNYVSFVSASDGGTLASGVVTWPAVRINAGQTVTRTVTVTVNQNVPRPWTATNMVVISGPGWAPPANPSCPATNPQIGCYSLPVGQPNLSVTKTDGQTIVQPGQRLTYTLTVKNTGDGAEILTTLKDTIPVGTTFVSASDSGTLASGVVTWPTFRINAGQTLTRTVTVTVNNNLARPVNLLNWATVAGYGQTAPTCPSDDARCATDTDQAPAPDLSITKDDGLTETDPGQTVTYTIMVKNNGAGDALNTTVVDTLPAHVTLAGVLTGTPATDTAPAAWTPVPATGWQQTDGKVQITGFRLNAGVTVWYQIQVRVDQAIPRPATLQNLVTVASDGGTPPDCPGDSPRCGTDVDDVPTRIVQVVKEVVDANLVDKGDLVWRITVGSAGTGTVRGVTVADRIPAQVDPASIVWDEPSQGEIVDGVWQVGDLPAGTTATVVVAGTINKPGLAVAESLINTVFAQSPDDPGKGRQPDLAPAATNDHNQTVVNVPVSGWLLPNDTGVDIKVTSNTDPAHGAVSVNPDGTYTYTPATGFTGPDRFTYTITDGNGKTATATVDLTVTGGPVDPAAADDQNSTTVATPVKGAVLSNDTGQGIKVTGNSDPEHGTVQIAADGTYVYTPQPGFTGVDTFAYQITDANGKTATANVTITVAGEPTLVPGCQDNDTVETDVDGCDYVPLNVPGTTLKVTKDDGQTVVHGGDKLVYTLTVSNTGRVAEPAAVLTDVLPAHTTFVKASDGGVLDKGRVVWPAMAVQAGQAVERTVTVRVDKDVPQPATLTNYATVGGTDTTIPPADPSKDCPKDVCATDTDQVPEPRVITAGGTVVGDSVWWPAATGLLLAMAVGMGALAATRRRTN